MLYGVGLGLSQLQQEAVDVENGTQLGDRTTNTEDLDNVQFMGLLELITTTVCHVDCEGPLVVQIWSLLRTREAVSGIPQCHFQELTAELVSERERELLQWRTGHWAIAA